MMVKMHRPQYPIVSNLVSQQFLDDLYTCVTYAYKAPAVKDGGRAPPPLHRLNRRQHHQATSPPSSSLVAATSKLVKEAHRAREMRGALL